MKKIIFIFLFGSALGLMNNFFFDINNPQYGKNLPQRMLVPGEYKIDIESTVEYASFPKSLLDDPAFDISLFRGKNNEAPWVCTDKVSQMIASVTENSHNVLLDQISAINTSDITVNELRNKLNDGTITLTPFVDVQNPLFNCMSMNKNLILNSDGHSYSFDYDALFTNYQPIVFVDYFGLNAFMYKQQLDGENTPQSSGAGLRYCDGHAYMGSMFSLGQRPVCLEEVQDTHRSYESGTVTVHKPNIVTIRRIIYQCMMLLYKWKTQYSGLNPYVPVEAGFIEQGMVTSDDCRKWAFTKWADFSKYVGSDDWGRDAEWYITNHKNGKCTKNLEPAATIDQVTQVLASTDTGDSLYNLYTKSCKDTIKNDGLWEEHQHSDRYAKLSRGYIDILMPTGKMVTPWAIIPNSQQFNDSYQENFMTYVWDPFTPSQICKYTQRFTAKVDTVVYLPGSMDLEYDFSNGAKYVKYFIADSSQTMFIVDSLQLITNLSSAFCIQATENDELYVTKNLEIIKYTKDKERKSVGKTINYYSDAYDRINTDTQGNVVSVQSFSADISLSSEGNINDIFTPKINNPPVNLPTADRSKNPTLTNLTTGALDAQQPMSIDQIITFEDSVRYEFESIRLKSNLNLHLRAMQQCRQAQYDYDNAVTLSQIAPTPFWTNMLKQSVQVDYGGNGVFNIKSCEPIRNLKIVPTLKTNSDLMITINSKLVSVSKIISSLYTAPSVGKCLSMPLIIFQLMTEPKEFIGQVTFDGIINIKRIMLMEECDYGKNFVFRLEQMVYLFSNYELVGRVPAEYIYNETLKRMPEPEINGEKIPKILMDIVAKITPVDIIKTDLKEKPMASIPTGIFSMSDVYTLAEKQSIALGLADIIAQMSRDKMWDAIYQATLPIGGGANVPLDPNEPSLFEGVVNGVVETIKDGIEIAKDFIVGNGPGAPGLGGTIAGVVTKVGDTVWQSILLPITITGAVLGSLILLFIMYKIFGNKNGSHNEEDENADGTVEGMYYSHENMNDALIKQKNVMLKNGEPKGVSFGNYYTTGSPVLTQPVSNHDLAHQNYYSTGMSPSKSNTASHTYYA